MVLSFCCPGRNPRKAWTRVARRARRWSSYNIYAARWTDGRSTQLSFSLPHRLRFATVRPRKKSPGMLGNAFSTLTISRKSLLTEVLKLRSTRFFRASLLDWLISQTLSLTSHYLTWTLNSLERFLFAISEFHVMLRQRDFYGTSVDHSLILISFLYFHPYSRYTSVEQCISLRSSLHYFYIYSVFVPDLVYAKSKELRHGLST